MIEDIISVFPKVIIDGDKEYTLYFEYHQNKEGQFVWVITYLNSCRIYYRDEQESFDILKNNFFEKFNNK